VNSTNIVPPPDSEWGRTDYGALPGAHSFVVQAFCPPSMANAAGESGTIRGNAKPRIADVTDGLSNTAVVGECAARPIGYNRLKQIFSYGPLPVDGVNTPVGGGGGAWADPFAYFHVAGALADNSGIRGGPCMINCTSDNELYSFHPGGCNVLFGDGSVHFLTETDTPPVVISLITRAGGEVPPSDY
jgi:prepilin-type processing-associated H-X9-DG protein